MRSRILIIGIFTLAGAVAGGLYFFRDRLFPSVGVNPYIQAALPIGYKPKVLIEIPRMPPGDFKRVVFPAGRSPFVLTMTELWNVETQTKVATIQYDIGPAALQALSGDGKHFAYEKDGVVNVLELASGQNVLTIPYDKTQGSLHFVEFAGPGRIVVSARAFSPPDPKKPQPSSTVALEVWDIVAHRSIHSFRVPDFNHTGAVVSADGKRLAAMGVNHLWIFDLETGKSLAEWQPPPGKYKTLLVPTGMRFSPDGQTVAAFLGMGVENSVMCWAADSGQLTGEHRFPALTSIGHSGPPLQWLPDSNGWLVDGHAIVHRSTGRIVWLLHTTAPFVNTVGVIDQNHLLAPVYDKRHTLISVPIPWTEIDAALKVAAAPDTALLHPGHPVSLQVNVGDLHLAHEQQTQAELAKALSERLAADGIPVSEQQPTLVYARFKEAPGRTLNVYSMGVFNPQQGVARQAQETQMALEIGIQSNDSPEPLWHTYLTRGAGLIVSGQGTTHDVHQDTFEALKRDIRRLPWPYFIPASKDTARLPIVSQL